MMDRNSNQTGWSAASGSVRGASHLRSGAPNQDACSFWVDELGASAVLAVSDGHGSLKHFRSQIGAALAVSVAVSLIRQSLEQGRGSGEDTAKDLTEVLPRRLVKAWRLSVAGHLEANPFRPDELEALESKEGRPTREQVENEPVLAYGATLLVAVSLGDFIVFLQLGDGDILVVDEERHTTRPLPGDERLIGNQTTSLCQPEAWKEFRVGSLRLGADSPPPALVLLSTDGYANSFRTEADFLLIGGDYLDMIRELGLEKVDAELAAILAEASAQGSGDDITLGIMVGPSRRNLGEGEPRLPSDAPRTAAGASVTREDREPARGPKQRTWRQRLRVASVMPMVALLFVAAVAYSWWSRLPAPEEVSGAAPAEGLAPSPALPSSAWVLSFDSGDLLWLKPGSTITAKDLGLSSEQKEGGDEKGPTKVAEVVEASSGIHLKNVSESSWKAILPPATERRIAPGESLTLVEGASITIGAVRVTVRRLSKLHEISTPDPDRVGDGLPSTPSPSRRPSGPKGASDADAAGKGNEPR